VICVTPELAYSRSGTTSLRVSCQDEKDELRRRELASFLRASRARLSPADVHLPRTARRRVAGLRREEVAELAGIGAAWYTWMEQARPLNVSVSTLERISVALQLDDQEREHLFLLGGQATPRPDGGDRGEVMGSVRQVLASLDPNPAYALNPRWDVIAWNRAAAVLFGDFEKILKSRRNIVSLTFTDKKFRNLFVDWEPFARCVIAHFRSDSAAHAGDPRWSELIHVLSQQSVEFREWWPSHQVAWPPNLRKELRHPVMGRVVFQTLDLELFRPARLRVVAYMPALDQKLSPAS
jgi:transcriptional regulator with XRE-family HTH domain